MPGTTSQNLIELRPALQSQLQDGLGWFLTAARPLRLPPHYEHRRATLKAEIGHHAGGLGIVFLFALFEAYWPYVKPRSTKADPNPPSNWHNYMTADDVEVLLAYRHIRHSVAHGFGGARARRHRSEFESVMDAGGLPGVTWDRQADVITLQDGAWVQCVNRMMNLVQAATATLQAAGF